MDEYSKTGPKTPKAEAALRARITVDQMKTLLEYGDQADLLKALKEKYQVGPNHPNFEKIMQIWRSAKRERF
jgi:hypothetical protein